MSTISNTLFYTSTRAWHMALETLDLPYSPDTVKHTHQCHVCTHSLSQFRQQMNEPSFANFQSPCLGHPFTYSYSIFLPPAHSPIMCNITLHKIRYSSNPSLDPYTHAVSSIDLTRLNTSRRFVSPGNSCSVASTIYLSDSLCINRLTNLPGLVVPSTYLLPTTQVGTYLLVISYVILRNQASCLNVVTSQVRYRIMPAKKGQVNPYMYSHTTSTQYFLLKK